MTKTLLLHAGMPKTGTTSIQNACHATRDEILRREGILYPAFGPNHTNPICTLFMNNPAQHISNRMANRTSDQAIAEIRARYRDSLVADLERDDWDRVLVSAEGIANLSQEELGNIRDFFAQYVDAFDVIYYVREPISYAASVMQQLLKGGATLGQLHRTPELPNYRGRIGNAIGAFGADNVRIRDFTSAAKSDGGLVADFCRQMDMDDDTIAVVMGASRLDNESLSLESARMLSQLNTLRPLFSGGQRNVLRTGKETLSLEKIPGNKFALPAKVRHRIWQDTRDDVSWMNATFGTQLFDTPEPSEDDDPIDPERRVASAHGTVTLISDLLNRIEALEASLASAHLRAEGKLEAAGHKAQYALRITPEHPQVKAEARAAGTAPEALAGNG